MPANLQKFQLELNWKITFACLILFPMLIALGFWQLNRADTKQTLLDDWYTQQANTPVFLKKFPEIDKIIFTPVQIEGKFDTTRYWLLENKYLNGKFGSQVVMPFRISGGALILVNRGWVKETGHRASVPEFSLPENRLILQGHLSAPSNFRLLDDMDAGQNDWPRRVLEIDTGLLANQYGENFYPKVLRLSEGSPAALAIDWQPTVTLPSRHTAYAVQWFSMACALVLLWFSANTNIVMLLRRQV